MVLLIIPAARRSARLIHHSARSTMAVGGPAMRFVAGAFADRFSVRKAQRLTPSMRSSW